MGSLDGASLLGAVAQALVFSWVGAVLAGARWPDRRWGRALDTGFLAAHCPLQSCQSLGGCCQQGFSLTPWLGGPIRQRLALVLHVRAQLVLSVWAFSVFYGVDPWLRPEGTSAPSRAEVSWSSWMGTLVLQSCSCHRRALHLEPR